MNSRDLDVWIIEDNAHLRATLGEIVDAADGLRATRIAEAYEEVLDALDQGTVPDVVLTDLGLPGIDGVEGIARIKTVSPNVQVVVLTVHDDRDRVFDAICAGANGYLLKPATAEGIVEAIRTAHRGGAPMNAFVARRVLDTFSRVSQPASDFGLTRREREILELIVEECTQNEMAERLFLSPHTVDTHLRNIYSKLHVRTRAGAVARAIKEGLLR